MLGKADGHIITGAEPEQTSIRCRGTNHRTQNADNGGDSCGGHSRNALVPGEQTLFSQS